MMSAEGQRLSVVEQLRRAVDDHDLDGVVGCFTPDYHNETPAHPGRGFTGHDQVRRNWERIFTGVPDISASVLRTAVDGETVWTEWEMRGTRPDGQPHLMRGVVIFDIPDDQATAARFYLEPVDAGDGGVTAAVTAIVGDERS
jgi:ketosteroid isomerase-like protein